MAPTNSEGANTPPDPPMPMVRLAAPTLATHRMISSHNRI